MFATTNARPTKSQQMLNADGWTVYYWSAQVTRAPCLCRTSFGADAHQKHVPTSSAMWQAGSRFEKLWDATLMKNYEAFQNRDLRPTWLDKSWQVLWNWNDHNKNHGISPHSDASATYSNVDPITAFSFGHGGVLTLGPKKGPVTRMLFQEGGDALVMAGDFQAEFCHGVPARSTWKDLKSLPMFATMQEWEKVGLQQEIALHEGAEPEAKHVRMNCTVRWHSTHWAGCPVRGQEGHGTQPVSTGAVQTSSSSLAPGEDTVNVSAGAAASTQGTQPVVTGAVRVPAASVVDPKQSLLFTGIKKRGVEEEATPSVSTVKTSRSGEELLLERSDETIKSLLDCIEACVRQNDLFTLAITGKTTIILELMLDVFCRFFPARPGEEERYMIATFSHAQSDAISNDVYRARTCHTACSYRVASLRNKHLALKTKEQEMKQRWQPKILVIQDEISLVPAAVENMMLYRSMRARQDEGLDPASYFHPGELMGHIPILLIAGDFLQIKPANEISLADNLEEVIRKMPHRVQTEHHAAQAALMTIDTVIHLKKSKRFLDAHLPEITTAMRTCTPAAPLSEDHLAQLRTRKIENCKKELTTDLFKHGHVIGMYWENIARSMVERANRDAQDLDVPLFCLQAADQRHFRKNKAIDKQLTHQLLTVPNPHRTGKLQGMLLVHENMVVRLADVLAPHLGLVKDKLAVVVKVDLHHEDQKRLDRREPGFCLFFRTTWPKVSG